MGFYEENRDDMISFVSTALAKYQVNSSRKLLGNNSGFKIPIYRRNIFVKREQQGKWNW